MSYKEPPYPAKTNNIEEVETNAFVFAIYLVPASPCFRCPLTQIGHDVLKTSCLPHHVNFNINQYTYITLHYIQ